MIKIVLGITGSIAAYKTPDLVRQLRENDYDVKVVLSSAATAFVTPLSLQAVNDHKVYEAIFDAQDPMSHITLAKWAEIILIAPASANCIAKLAHGLGDDLLSTICLATTYPIILAPAMNQQMWKNNATQDNVAILKKRGVHFLGPDKGIQACGDDGPGRMMEPHDIVTNLKKYTTPKLLNQKKILIITGPTQEAIDPVRFISNKSSGKMGYALAEAAIALGAQVTLISGPTALTPPDHCQVIPVTTADEMFTAVQNHIDQQDIFISCAAVSDYKINRPETHKIKKTKDNLILALTPTTDILSIVTNRKRKPFTIGFAAETQDAIKNGKEKLQKKNLDMIVINDVSQTNIGFASDDNAVTILTQHQKIVLPKKTKKEIAMEILNFLYSCID